MGDYPRAPNGRSRSADLPTTMFDLSAAITAGGATLDYTADPLRAIDVGGDGNLVLTLIEDSAAVTVAVKAGQRWVGAIKTVTKAGTTATGLVGLR